MSHQTAPRVSTAPADASQPAPRQTPLLRRVLKAVTLGKEPGDISTIEDEGSVEEARESWGRMRQEMAAAHDATP